MLLNYVKFCEYLSKKITLFFENNGKLNNDDVSDSVLLETMKAVIRGDIIAYQTSKRWQNRAYLIEINKFIKRC